MLGLVYSKEAPDGGKTKGTSHYSPRATCTPKLHFSAFTPYSKYMFPPTVHCTLSCSCLICSIFYLLFFLYFSILISFTKFHPSSPIPLSLMLCLFFFFCSSSFLLSPLSFSFLPPAFSSLCFHSSSFSILQSATTCWLAQSKTPY